MSISTFKVSWTLSMSPSALNTKSPTFHERSLPTTRFVAQTLMTSAYSIQCIAGALTAELHNIYQEGGTARWNSSSSMRMVPSVGIPGTKFSSRASPTSSFVDPFHNSGHWYSRSQKPLARHPQATSSPSRLYTHPGLIGYMDQYCAWSRLVMSYPLCSSVMAILSGGRSKDHGQPWRAPWKPTMSDERRFESWTDKISSRGPSVGFLGYLLPRQAAGYHTCYIWIYHCEDHMSIIYASTITSSKLLLRASPRIE